MHHPKRTRKPRFSFGAYGYGLLRIGVGLEVLALTWRTAAGFDEAARALASWGFPAPPLSLLISVGAGLLGGLALLLGVRVRLAVAGLGALFLPTTSLLLALHTGDAGSAWQGLLQLGRLVEAPLLMGFFVWALAVGAGPFSLGGLRGRRKARQAWGGDAVEAEPVGTREDRSAARRPASADRERGDVKRKVERKRRAAAFAPCCP